MPGFLLCRYLAFKCFSSGNDLVPSAKSLASFKLPDYNSGKLEVQYFHEHAALSTAVGLKKSRAIVFLQPFVLPSYVTSSSDFTKYSAGVNFTKPDSSASVIL
ncbi:hypothetical protein V6N12_074998 [Hibiscus sabdariffa]|uniref:Uncharacterized protein n=1 Tax=Hibiscus sabdariffa TaxID=183260 RepID=A0ABR2BZ61_9ROSI